VRLCLGDREARADFQRRELIDCIAAGAPVGEILFVVVAWETEQAISGNGRRLLAPARQAKKGS